MYMGTSLGRIGNVCAEIWWDRKEKRLEAVRLLLDQKKRDHKAPFKVPGSIWSCVQIHVPKSYMSKEAKPKCGGEHRYNSR